jgi:prevent-host-death family protein
MEKTVGAFDARRQLGKILKEVAGKGDRYVVNLHGEPVAAVVPIELYRQWKRDREEFFAQLEAIAERANVDPDEAEALADEAVRAVRAART